MLTKILAIPIFASIEHVSIANACLKIRSASLLFCIERGRYQTAVDARVLAEKSLEAEQKRFVSGVSSVALVIQAQKDLSANQDAEVQAMANYTHARIAFDVAMGRTLEANHIIMEEALSGHVERESVLPPNLPPAPGTGGAK